MNIKLIKALMANTDLLIEYVQELVDFPGDMAMFSCRERVEDLVAKILIHTDLVTKAVSNEYKDLEGPQFFSVFWGIERVLWPYKGESLIRADLSDIEAKLLPQVSTLSDVLNFELRDMLKAAELKQAAKALTDVHSYRKQREIEAGYDQTRNTRGSLLAGDPVEIPQRTWMDDMYPGPIMGVDPISENPPVVMLNGSLTAKGDPFFT
jgi:hypothetical protein